MRKIVRFTFLGFHLTSIKDSGNSLDLAETQKHLKEKTLFPFLKTKFGDRLDISLYKPEELENIEELFHQLYWNVDSKRKFGIEHDGLSLLIAYCFEGIQQDI